MCKTMVCDKCTYILSDFKRVCKNCGFLKCYVDSRGTVYFVRPDVSRKGFKTYFVKPGDKKQRDYIKHRFQFSFAEAQTALNVTARGRKWAVYDGESPAHWSIVV